MNELIKQLSKRAGISIDNMGYGEGNIEEFAELIIKECLHVIASASLEADKTNRYQGDDVPSFMHIRNIKKHFKGE